MERPKTYAERQLERAEAVQRLKQQISGTGDHPCSITSSDIPDQIERPKPSKTFVIVGVIIIALLIVAHFISAFSNSKGAKQRPAEAGESLNRCNDVTIQRSHRHATLALLQLK